MNYKKNHTIFLQKIEGKTFKKSYFKFLVNSKKTIHLQYNY